MTIAEPIKCHSKSKSNASDVRPQRSDDSEISDILPVWAGWLGSIAVGIALANAEKVCANLFIYFFLGIAFVRH